MIESHFQHRGYDIRIKEFHRNAISYTVRTPTGPIWGNAGTVMQARRRAIEVVNEYSAATDWTYTTGTVLSEASSPDDVGRVSSIRREAASS